MTMATTELMRAPMKSIMVVATKTLVSCRVRSASLMERFAHMMSSGSGATSATGLAPGLSAWTRSIALGQPKRRSVLQQLGSGTQSHRPLGLHACRSLLRSRSYLRGRGRREVAGSRRQEAGTTI